MSICRTIGPTLVKDLICFLKTILYHFADLRLLSVHLAVDKILPDKRKGMYCNVSSCLHTSRIARKPVFRVSDTRQAEQPQKMARDLKF